MRDTKLRSPSGKLAISRPTITIVLGLVIALVGAACSGGGGGGGGGEASTIAVGSVDNPSMADLKKLVPDFQSSHPNIKVNIVTLPEDQIRQQVTQDVATQSGRFDLFTIGTYEVPLWAKLGWLQDLAPYIAKDSSYAPDDLIPGIRTALTYNNDLYAVPFYGESSMLMYRKDLLAAKGVTMPDHPTWDQVAAAGQKVKDWSGWLWAWTLAMGSASTKKDAAWTFADWATSKAYAQLVGTKLGWARVSPGTRTSTYSIPEYKAAAGAFAQVTLDSIAHADVTHPTVEPVPYVGVQYADITEFQQLGDQVYPEFAKVIAGNETVDQALQKAQALAAAVGQAP